MTAKRKQRARTNSNVPAKGRLREMADRLWSIAVRSDWAWKCAVCGSGKVEAHHLTPRDNEATRFTIRNGVALCASHHKFDNELSPHLNAAGWIVWLEANHPSLAEWYFAHCRDSFDGTKNAPYYCGIIQTLKPYVEDEEFERIVGIKFSRWLGEQTT
eukprot:GHVU01179885.1.p1 GENE.GHVU01179885.1~~GHVU01179885.1.p1  ORF type:complete len:158 (+),score=17.88 GHVU01179885.1:97-570(+)